MKEKVFSDEESQAIARGLYWIANVDGIDDAEVELIREFIEESGSDWSLEDVQTTSFDPRELPVVLESSFLRYSFLKAAVAIVAADGKITPWEQQALRKCARLFGMSDQAYAELEEEVCRISIYRAEQLPEKKAKAPKKNKSPKRKE